MNLVAICIAAVVSGQPAAAEPAAAANVEASGRLTEMQQAAAGYKLFRGQEQAGPLRFIEKPILRYADNVTGVPDGTLFVWTQDARPEAVISVWYHPSGARFHELQSLSETTLVAKTDADVQWSPNVPGVEFRAFENPAPPAANERQRLTQTRELAGQFAAAVSDMRFGRQELRLLPQPIYRYGNQGSAVLDGALFAFVKGTNPEIMLLIEARSSAGGGHTWHYAPVRMSSRECELSYDGKPVWHLPQTRGQDPAGPYFNRIFR